MIPNFEDNGDLPPGIHLVSWEEFVARYGTSPHRQALIAGLKRGLEVLTRAGCHVAYIDGSFVTAKDVPRDFDACWDIQDVDPTLLDPVFLDFKNKRAAQKAKYLGEFFPAQFTEGCSNSAFVDFFQINKDTGLQKGIIAIHLKAL